MVPDRSPLATWASSWRISASRSGGLGGGEIGLVASLMRAAYPPWLRRATGQRVKARPPVSQGLALTTWCLAHPLRRCHQLISDAVAGQAKTRTRCPACLSMRWCCKSAATPAAWLRPRSPLRWGRSTLTFPAVDRLVAGATHYPPHRRLLDRLARERTHLFTFLRVPGVPATNWRAEQAHPPTWPSPAPIGIRRPPRAQTLWKRWIMPASGPRP